MLHALTVIRAAVRQTGMGNDMSPRIVRNLRNMLLGSFAIIAAATVINAPAGAQQQEKPNILIIWGDDIGQSDENGRDIQGFLTRLCGQFCTGRSGREVQSACHDRCRHRSLFERDAEGAVRGIHFFASVRIGLSAWYLRDGPQRTESSRASALRIFGNEMIAV
jgi:hypothetical protein